MRRTDAVVVIGGAGTDLDSLVADAGIARRAARRAWPRWQGRLVIEVTPGQRELAAAVGADPAAYDGVVAVTSTRDGSTRRDDPIRVFVNHEELVTMSPAEARLVLTHEAVHVALRSPVTALPMWWEEGFAEYIAVGAATPKVAAKVDATQREALTGWLRSRVRERSVPTAAELAGPRAEAAYAAAWLLVDTMTRESRGSGRAGALPDLRRFHTLLTMGVPEGVAFRAALGVSRGEVLSRWHRRLVRLGL